MASAAFVIRCKTADGQFTISDLSGNSTIKAMKDSIQSATAIKTEKMKILFGYPPKPLVQNENTKLHDVDIRSGDTLIVQVEDALDVHVVPEMSKPPADADCQNEERRNNCLAIPEMVSQMVFFNSGDMLSNYNGIMMRHDVPSNNSCLFTSIYFILNRGEINLTRSDDLRKIVAEAIRRDPVKYNSAYLGRDNREYSDWILNPINWGGAIELAIFSEYFNLEICAIDIISCTMHRFGEGNGYKDRGILIYDGIHYDPLVMHLESDQKTIFPATDSRPLEMAMEIAKEAQSSRQFTDVHNFRLKCNVCGLRLCGEKEATAHAQSTNHTEFGEL